MGHICDIHMEFVCWTTDDSQTNDQWSDQQSTAGNLKTDDSRIIKKVHFAQNTSFVTLIHNHRFVLYPQCIPLGGIGLLSLHICPCKKHTNKGHMVIVPTGRYTTEMCLSCKLHDN